MSRKSEYTIDMVIESDKVRDSIRSLEAGLSKVTSAAKETSKGIVGSQDLSKVQKASEEMISGLHELAKDTSLDFEKVTKTYTKNSQKAISVLEKDYAKHQDQLTEVQSQYAGIQDEIDAYKQSLQEMDQNAESFKDAMRNIYALEQKQRELGVDKLKAYIQQNRVIRKNIIEAGRQAKEESKFAKRNEKYDKLKALNAKLKASTNKAEKKSLNDLIKLQKTYIKSVEKAEKQQKAVTKAIQGSAKEQSKLLKSSQKLVKAIGGATKFAYNAAGLVGGAGRMVKGAGRAVGDMVSSVVQGAEREVDRENAVRRIKGKLPESEKRELLSELYIKTDADYSSIVEAIGRVQSVLGTAVSKHDLHNATFAELRSPGAAAMIRQSNSPGEHSADTFVRYDNRMRAIQSATGASREQISASTERIANMRASSFSNASLTELQSVYLSLQNSGAYDSQEELDRAFDGFVRSQKHSKNDVFTHAQNFDWQRYAYGQTNKQQISMAIGNVDWGSLKTAASTDNREVERTDSERMSEKMRLMEEEKSKLMMKLIPAVLPLVEALSKILQGDTAQQIIQGLSDLFTTVVPLLDPVFKLLKVVLDFLNLYILKPLKLALEWVYKNFKLDDGKDSPMSFSSNARANGGIVFGPALVGERAFQPEMILPLDYSRRARAGNIVSSVHQTFNMAGSETSALSLAQAVKSRDFRLATSQTEFLLARGGLV